jgi:peptide/nickel transport system ATP-binding protein
MFSGIFLYTFFLAAPKRLHTLLAWFPVPSLLQIQDLTINFCKAMQTVPAVRGLCFDIHDGEALGLVGESGSGKSVTALAIMRLLEPTAHMHGTIRFAGQDLLALDEESMRQHRGRQIAMIFQEPMSALNPVMPVGRQVAEALEVHQPELSRWEVKQRVLEAFEAVALPSPERRYKDYPHQFSGGQRQRILIAMALINRPKLLIADEPTTALDVTVQAQILQLLTDLRRRFRLATLFISHDLAVVSKIADHVLVMRHGVALEYGSRKQIFSNPVHPYTKSLLGAIPTLAISRDLPLSTLAPMAESSSERMQEFETGHWVRR